MNDNFSHCAFSFLDRRHFDFSSKRQSNGQWPAEKRGSTAGLINTNWMAIVPTPSIENPIRKRRSRADHAWRWWRERKWCSPCVLHVCVTKIERWPVTASTGCCKCRWRVNVYLYNGGRKGVRVYSPCIIDNILALIQAATPSAHRHWCRPPFLRIFVQIFGIDTQQLSARVAQSIFFQLSNTPLSRRLIDMKRDINSSYYFLLFHFVFSSSSWGKKITEIVIFWD